MKLTYTELLHLPMALAINELAKSREHTTENLIKELNPSKFEIEK